MGPLPVPGMNLGMFSVPPIGAGVWVEFEQGDPGITISNGKGAIITMTGPVDDGAVRVMAGDLFNSLRSPLETQA